jgi:GNAT superfamily N-acetyltransferase
MLDYVRLAPGEAFDRAVVEVVFLRMNMRPTRPAVVWPEGTQLRAERLGIEEYRELYKEVGKPWLWWLRQIMPDDLLTKHLESPSVAVQVLYKGGRPVGFFETDAGYWPDVNLNYFGLVPEQIGKGLGRILLDAAVDSVFLGSVGLRGMTVNTCSADHPNALPNYVAAGFREMRRVPEHLRG